MKNTVMKLSWTPLVNCHLLNGTEILITRQEVPEAPKQDLGKVILILSMRDNTRYVL
jgi:hypothetical protein